MENLRDRKRQSLPTGTVTFLFTDIEGSTTLARSYPEQMPAMLKRHHAILRQAIRDHDGHVFRIVGDAFCASFHTASDALGAALTAQRLLQHENWGPAIIAVRMGIHTGAAQLEDVDDPSDAYRGYLTLACAQRVMSTAHGGQVLLSGASAELVRGQLPEGIALLDMGDHRLKGGLEEHLWQLAADDLRTEFPPLSTLSTTPNNLPTQINSFIGRQHELAQTRELLATTHLLTLIGPGGTGKTRLSIQLASEILQEYPDGVWLVELAPLTEPGLVLQTIAAILGLREIPGTPLRDLVANYLQSKRSLLILDNCEHLVETCAQLAGHLISYCPSLRLIASSREALGITGETVFRVPPLNLPDADRYTVETVRDSEAVQLFVDRARAVKTDFALTARNAVAVAQICRRMDGIPLALELAAARVGMFTPEQIAARLDDRFQLLTGGSRTALPRQQTLRSMIDWSYDLLPEAERRLFCELSVFAGGWSLEAAEAVCPDLDVMELLTQLLNKSLVVADERPEQVGTRFRFLETIRQYARDRLLERGTSAEVRDRHLDYYLRFAETAEINFAGPQGVEWVAQVELETDNLRAALQWALDHNIEAALRLAGALTVYWGRSRYLLEARHWLQTALDREAALPKLDGEAGRRRLTARAKGLSGFSGLFYGRGEYQAGLDSSREAVQLYRQLEDWPSLGFALGYVGNMAAFQNDMALAEQALTEAIRIGRELGNKVVLCFALGVYCHYVALPRGDVAAARTYLEESVRLARELGMTWAEGMDELVSSRIFSTLERWDDARRHALRAQAGFQALHDSNSLTSVYNELARIEVRTGGDLAEARRYLSVSILHAKEMDLRAQVAQTLESFANIAQAQAQPERAARLLGAAEAVRERLGTSPIAVHRLGNEYERLIAWLRAQLDETAYEAYWSEGCAMSMEQAIAYALENPEE